MWMICKDQQQSYKNVNRPQGELQAIEVTPQVTYTNGGDRWPPWLMISFT